MNDKQWMALEEIASRSTEDTSHQRELERIDKKIKEANIEIALVENGIIEPEQANKKRKMTLEEIAFRSTLGE